MRNIFGCNNVYYDDGSIYLNLSELNEYKFLNTLFSELKSSMDEKFEDFHFWIFCGDGKKKPHSLNEHVKGKKVLLYLSDESGYVPKELSKCYDIIFKIHLKESYPEYNIYPFPLGYVQGVEELPYVRPQHRRYNCFFSGNLNPGREVFWLHFLNSIERVLFGFNIGKIRILNKYTKKLILNFKKFYDFDRKFPDSIIRFTSSFRSGFNLREYSYYLQQSKIVLCPKGFISAECYRHYEALRAGCILISERLPNTFFYNKSPIIQISDWHELDGIVKGLLSSPQKLEELSLCSKEWYLSHMSEIAISKYMSNILLSK